jgi:hypothetical protein
MTVYVADTHAHVQRLVSVVKMVTMLKECTAKEQRSLARFLCGQKGSMKRILIKECFMFTVWSVCHVKWFTTGSRNSLKDVRKPQICPTKRGICWDNSRKDFYAAGLDALVERWDNCINVSGEYIEKECFLQVWISHVLRFIFICYLKLPRIFLSELLCLDSWDGPRFKPFMDFRLVWSAGLLNLFLKRIHVHRNKKRLSLLTAFKRQFVYLQKESK